MLLLAAPSDSTVKEPVVVPVEVIENTPVACAGVACTKVSEARFEVGPFEPLHAVNTEDEAAI